MTKEKILSITIDNKKAEVRPGLTILQAARENNVFIPSLCTLEHLPSYGACRLCMVEVDGLRGFPTSCTTPIEDGMVIRTDTAEIRSLRQEVLKLLLSEHPASCLFCTEQSECRQYQGTIRKVGATTGCRYCPNDNRCELQEITEKIGLTETSYPVYYRNFTVEKYDPFYDRDYNLCILCGRCVRVCNNVRLNGTLSFKQRGKLTTIGPAFDRSHLEAGCEFCGACVTVCPTGALSTKVSKWYGKPDSQVMTTCNYCSTGCQVVLQTKNNEVIDALPDYDSPVDHGLICVKGRFAIPEYVHSPLRYPTPKRLTPVGYEDISWDQAITEAAERLSGIKPEDFMMMVSPQLSNEDLFVAQQFMRKVMGSENIVSSMISELGNGLMEFLDLATHSDSFDVIDQAQGIFAIGFDSTYGYSPIGISVKKAAQRGVALITLDSVDTNLDILSETAFKMDVSRWADFLDLFIDQLSAKGKGLKSKSEKHMSGLVSLWGDDIERVSKLFLKSSTNVIIAGPKLIGTPDGQEVMEKLLKIRDGLSWKVIFAHPYTNLAGMFAMGAFPNIEPGQVLSGGTSKGHLTVQADLTQINFKKHRKVLYLIGEAPFDIIPDCDYLIYQNGLPVKSARQPDLILPASLFTESTGTIINVEGRILPVQKAVEPFMESKPDWWILSRIAEKMDKGRLKYKDISSIHGEIKKHIKGFPGIKKRLEFSKISVKGTGSQPFWKVGGDSYRGIMLAEVVSGMKVITERIQSIFCSDKEAQ